MPRQYTPRIALSCEVCGKTVMLPPSIIAQGRRRCSAACMGVAKRRSTPVTCVGCQKIFEVSPSQARVRKYCSLQCRRDHEKPSIRCEVCGRERRVSPSLIEQGARFCSWECARTVLNAPRPIVKCIQCGRDRAVPPSDAKVRRFCSHSCRSIYNITHGAMASPTSIELILYRCLDQLGMSYLPQHPIVEAGTVPDAYIPERRLVLYADGDYWHTRPTTAARDVRQNTKLSELGYTVRRLSEADLRRDPLNIVRQALET